MEASVAYLSVIVIGVFSRERSSTLITMWTVLTSLLKRPHNLILTWIHLLQYSLISPHLTAQLNPFYNNLAHYWIGMAWYFQEVAQNVLYLIIKIESDLNVIFLNRETAIIWPGSILLLATLDCQATMCLQSVRKTYL